MDDTSSKLDPIEAIAEALRAFGEDTAGNIAEKVAMAYSTVTPKLRALEEAGRAERVKHDGRTFWRPVTTAETAPDPDGATDTSRDTTERAVHDTACDGAAPPAAAVTDAPRLPDGAPEPATESTARSQPQPPAQSAAAQPEPTTPTTPPAPASTNPGDAPTDEVSNPSPAGDSTEPDNAPDTVDASLTPVCDADPAQPPVPDPSTAEPGDGSGADAAEPPHRAPNAAPATPAGGKTRRPPGELDRTSLRIMQANPNTAYKVGELARLIDQADADDGKNYPKASPGAVVLSCDRLVDRNNATRVSDKPATYQLAPTQPANP